MVGKDLIAETDAVLFPEYLLQKLMKKMAPHFSDVKAGTPCY